jgi:hypothetical protein
VRSQQSSFPRKRARCVFTVSGLIHESLRDVGIAEAAGDELEDLAFPLGQLGQRVAFGPLAEALMTADASIGFAARGIDNQLTAGDYVQLLTRGRGGGLLAGLGVGVGARNSQPGCGSRRPLRLDVPGRDDLGELRPGRSSVVPGRRRRQSTGRQQR